MERTSVKSSDLAKMASELIALRKDFEDHLLSDAKEFEGLRKALKENTALTQQTHNNVQEILDIISALTLGRKLVIGFSVTLGAIIGGTLGLKTILGWFR